MESKPVYSRSEWEKRLGTDVRGVRLAQRLTQAEVAERSNVPLAGVKYIGGGKGSSLSTLIRVARTLGRTDWLTSFAPAEPSVSPVAMLRERQRQTATAARRVRRPKRSK